MRVTTGAVYQRTLAAIQLQQGRLAKVQTQMSSGLRLQSAKDDPAAVSQVLGLQKGLADITQWQTNVNSLSNRLGPEDSALGSVSDSLTKIQSYALQANNATLTSSDRQSLIAEIQQQFDEILNNANLQDGSGRYLFGGTADATTPFVKGAGGSVNYFGNSTLASQTVGPNSSIAGTDPGDSVFMAIQAGDSQISVAANTANTGGAYVSSAQVIDPSQYDEGQYTVSFTGSQYQVADSNGVVVTNGTYQAGTAIQFRGLSLTFSGTPSTGDSFAVGPAAPQDVFTTINNLTTDIGNLNSKNGGAAQAQTSFYQSLQSLQTAIGHIANIRGGVGARESALQDNAARLSDLSVQYQTTVSGLQDTDYAAASTQFSQAQLTLQAAEQSYASIQGLSLFNYLK